MAGIKDVANIWKNVREVDLRPIREEALQTVKIALVGIPGSGRHTLAAQMRTDPARPLNQTQTPVLITDLDTLTGVTNADLIILVLDATVKNYQHEQELTQHWTNAGKKVLVFGNKSDLLGTGQVLEGWVTWPTDKIVYGSAKDSAFLLHTFAPAVMELLPNKHLALGRQFPLFRTVVAQEVINETCFSNAAYAFSTGLAEIIPVLDLPLNITDMIVLTKAQAFMVYKLGLNFGFSTRWQDYLAEFGSVIGGGFVWRQFARELIGLIPVWGIVPKVAVSYAGTYVVGHAILQWYLTGRHVSRQQMNDLYKQAFARGKNFARNLVQKAPRPRLTLRLVPQLGARKPKALAAPGNHKICANCGRQNAVDASYCQYCGQPQSV